MPVFARYTTSHVAPTPNMKHGFTWWGFVTYTFTMTLTGSCSNPLRRCDVTTLGHNLKAALDSLLPGGASGGVWACVAESTRVGYLRSLRKWLQFSAAHKVDAVHPQSVEVTKFV